MTILKIGVATRSFRGPLRRALDAAGRLDADGVEIDLRNELPYADLTQTALRQIRKLLEDLNLSVGAASFPLRRGFGDPADLDRRVAAVMAAMTAAAQLGARVLIVPIGALPPEESEDGDEATRDRMLESLTAVAAHGDRVGARLAVATGADAGEHLAVFLQALPDGVLGVDLNPARLLAAAHEPLAAVRALGPSILHVHANDAVRDLASGNPASGGVVDVPLGRGSVDFPELLASLEEHEYRGWITVERAGAADPERELGDAVAYLRTLLRNE